MLVVQLQKRSGEGVKASSCKKIPLRKYTTYALFKTELFGNKMKPFGNKIGHGTHAPKV